MNKVVKKVCWGTVQYTWNVIYDQTLQQCILQTMTMSLTVD